MIDLFAEKRKDEDYDEEVEIDLQEEHNTDEYTLSKVSDIMHSLFKIHREATIPFFQQLLPDFITLLVSFHRYDSETRVILTHM